jgi:hypothetical protein
VVRVAPRSTSPRSPIDLSGKCGSGRCAQARLHSLPHGYAAAVTETVEPGREKPRSALAANGMAVTGGSATLGSDAGLAASGMAVTSRLATLTRHEFRDLSVAAGRAALARLEAKAGSFNNSR